MHIYVLKTVPGDPRRLYEPSLDLKKPSLGRSLLLFEAPRWLLLFFKAPPPAHSYFRQQASAITIGKHANCIIGIAKIREIRASGLSKSFLGPDICTYMLSRPSEETLRDPMNLLRTSSDPLLDNPCCSVRLLDGPCCS